MKFQCFLEAVLFFNLEAVGAILAEGGKKGGGILAEGGGRVGGRWHYWREARKNARFFNFFANFFFF